METCVTESSAHHVRAAVSAAAPHRYELLYAMLFEAMPSPALLLDRQLRIVAANRRFLEGAQRSESATVGQRVAAVLSDGQTSVVERIRHAFERNESVRGACMICRAPGPGNRFYDYRLVPIPRRGATEHVVVLMEDVSERAQLLLAQKLAALGVFARGIAHEIRNPLCASSSAAQFLRETADDPEFRRQCIERILDGIRRASLVIENLLRFAQPGVGMTRVPLDLVAIMQEAAALITSQADLQRVTVEFELAAHPLLVSGVPALLQQAFTNLLLNALSAMPAGGRLRVRMAAVGEEVQVRICDSGRGIPPYDIEKIFDPFFTTMPVGKGTGLGLSMCYSIIRQHSGCIEVESMVGGGSIFTVRLPLLADSPTKEPAPHSKGAVSIALALK